MHASDVIRELKEGHWSVQGFNGMPLYLHCAATDSAWLTNEKFGQCYSRFCYLFSRGRAYMYYDEDDWDWMNAIFYEQVKTEADLQALEAEYQAAYETRKADAAFDPAMLGTLDDASLVALAQKALSRLAYAAGFAHIIEGVTFGSEKMLKGALERGGAYNEMDFSTLCSPVQASFLADAQKKLLAIKAASDTDALVKEYLEAYGWVQTTYLGPKEISAGDVLKQADAMTEASITDYDAVKSEKAMLVEKYALTPQEQFVLHSIERCFVWQDDRKKNILESVYAGEPLLMEISRRFDIPLMALKFAIPGEFTLEKLQDPEFRTSLEERCKKSAFYTLPEGDAIFTGEDFDAIAESVHVVMTEEVKELKGVTASKGKATGLVRICESVSDIDKCQEGDVLVASMTRPEYLPAMQKAIAFVTNEGGITCHAAIVSREMRKPCVIGTRVATQVLKDGDTVEVDGDAGMVRIIQRAG